MNSKKTNNHSTPSKLDLVDIVIARRPEADVAISYPSKDKGCSGAKAPHDHVHSFDCDGGRVISVELYLLWTTALRNN